MEIFGRSRYGQSSFAASRWTKTSSVTPRSRAMNASNGSVEPLSADVRHAARQPSNCSGDASATDATRFFTELKAMCCFCFNSQNPEKLQNLRRYTNANFRPDSTDFHPRRKKWFPSVPICVIRVASETIRHYPHPRARHPMKIDSNDFRARPDKNVRLKDWPTGVKPFYKSKAHYEEILAEHKQKLSERQDLLYASNRYALLLIFQAMDAAGKDGAIKHVMSGVNPQGCQVFSFKHPSATELQHDFLWRTTRDLPERGRIGIFNRSYYEEVLIVRVHPEILQSEGLPDGPHGHKLWHDRYRSIVDLERHLFG